MISISIVSHGQMGLVKNLLKDLKQYDEKKFLFEVIVTLNIPEEINIDVSAYDFELRVIKNLTPKGFGANHNQAFKIAKYDYFCVLNPDIRIDKTEKTEKTEKNERENIFLELISVLDQERSIGVVGPQIVDENNIVQDNARKFLTPLRLLKRVLFKQKSDYNSDLKRLYPDWIAGMFMLFPSEIYKSIGGFDEGYYLYCEDMDICYRLKKKSNVVCQVNNLKAIHLAQRTSHRKLQYLYWHIASLMRFFIKTYLVSLF